MTPTGRECGTSASSAPSVTTSCTPSASASSTTVSQNVRQRYAGSGPERIKVARGARHARLEDLDVGPLDHALVAAGEADRRARGLEVDELLGVDDREALGVEAGAEERERRRGGLPGVVPALEGADQSRGAEPVRAAIPAQGLHRPPTVADPSAPRPPSSDQHGRRRAELAAGRRRGRRRLRLHAQGPADRAHRHALPRAGAARPHLGPPGARVPRRRPARRPLRPRRPRPRPGPGGALPRRAAGRGPRDRARGRTPTRPRSCPSPTATSTSSTASSSTSRARSTSPATARCSRACSATPRCARAWRRAPCTRGGHHAYLGGLLEHTVAVGTLALEACQLHPRLNSRPAGHRGARPRPGQDARVHLRRRDRALRGGPPARPRRARPAAARAAARRA